MPLIQLRDGVSVDEHILDVTHVGYSAEGECTIEHPRYGTVGKIYDPETKTFSEVVKDPEPIVQSMTMGEAVGIDKARKDDPIVAKILDTIVEEYYPDDEAISYFHYLMDTGLITDERMLEIVRNSKYAHIADELFGLTTIEIDPLESIVSEIEEAPEE